MDVMAKFGNGENGRGRGAGVSFGEAEVGAAGGAGSVLGDVERCVVGAVLLEPALAMGVCERRGVDVDWFMVPECREVWPVLVGLWREGGVVDGPLVAERIGRRGVLGWLTGCMDRCVSAKHVGAYVEQLAAGRLTRLVVGLGRDLIKDAGELGGQAALERAEGALAALREAEKASYGGFATVGDFEGAIVADYELVRQRRIVEGDLKFFTGLRLPWDVLNVKYTGVKPGIHIVAARPSQGKTAIAVCMSGGLAFDGVRQLFFSVDMHPRLLAERYGALFGQVSLPKLNFGGSWADIEKLKAGLWRVRHAGAPGREGAHPDNILISDAWRVDRMVGEIHRAVKYDGVRCVWVDYLQILSGDREYRTHKEEIDAVLARLKQTALGLGIPIFCLAQLNRENGKDPSREPQLTDLGDSGSIEREASTVLMLWKDPAVRKAWDEAPPLDLALGQESLAEKLEPMWLLLLKNQQGATGRAPFVFYKNYFMFRPGDHSARPVLSRDKSGRVIKEDRGPFFGRIRDDFLVLTKSDGTGLDDWLEAHGTLGFRGLENLNRREVRE